MDQFVLYHRELIFSYIQLNFNDSGPISIYFCVFFLSDGRSRAGVYCAANACIEQVIQHGEVDIFQAIKTVRRHRPQLIENMVNFVWK